MATETDRSGAPASVHEMMEGLAEASQVSKRTMREFDEVCLEPTPAFSPEAIRVIRKGAHVSQPMFARYLNVSKNLVSDWERGAKQPGGSASRLLAIAQARGLEAIV